MYELNTSHINTLASGEQITYINNNFIVPQVLIIVALIFLVFIISGSTIIKTAEGRKKFLVIWLLNFVVSSIIVTIFLLLPNAIITLIKSIFST